MPDETAANTGPADSCSHTQAIPMTEENGHAEDERQLVRLRDGIGGAAVFGQPLQERRDQDQQASQDSGDQPERPGPLAGARCDG